ncbi:hypothetical protein MRB53_017134 [Persea americana]|uniref:Uncharacterized protein n=1 Tax=Persea americana TaxID=3435 RepID=A0ACC2M4A4_PERAE|nr:hypothetical protein MRB53_017134 [Persea americana]
MAEEEVEKGIISVSPKIAISNGGNLRRNSTGQAITRTSLSLSSSSEKVLPHYLRASTSSCHDFCKYGRKHAFQAKENCLFPRKVVGDMETTVEGHNQLKDVNLGGRKKKPLIKPPSTPELKIELLEKPIIIKQKALRSARKTEISIKPAIPSKQRSVTAKSCPANFSGVSSSRRSSVNSPLNRLGCIIGKRNSGVTPMSPSGGINVEPSSENNPSNRSSHLSSGRNGEKHLSIPSGGSLSAGGNTKKELVKNIDSSKIGEKKSRVTSLSPQPSVSRVTSIKAIRYRNSKLSSPILNRNKAGKAEPKIKVMEKTLYAIELKPECKSLEPTEHDETINRSSGSSLSSSSFPSMSSNEAEKDREESESESEFVDTIHKHDKTGTNRAEYSKGGERRRPRRSAMIRPEDSVPEKLKFQRGKVVSPEPENNGPRRLIFRPGRVVGENQSSLESENRCLKRLKFRQGRIVGVNLSSKVDIGRRSFRRNQDLGSGDVNATKVEAPTIVLKHQDVQGKKEDRGLFNHVIEETANKLVETKKSKVKALVGAFEIVISLQENKSAATV